MLKRAKACVVKPDEDDVTPSVDENVSSKPHRPALFMIGEWRKQLCRCPECDKMYSDSGVDYLPKVEDTVHFYEAKAKENGKFNDSEDVFDIYVLTSFDQPNVLM